MRGRNRQISKAVHNSPCLRKSMARRILGRWLNTACALNGAGTSWGMKEGKKRKKKKKKSEHKVNKLILNFYLFLFSRCWVLDIKNHPLTNCRLGHTQLPALLLSVVLSSPELCLGQVFCQPSEMCRGKPLCCTSIPKWERCNLLT